MTEAQFTGSGQDDEPGRDPRLALFADGGLYDRARPDARMATVLEDVTGDGGRPPAAASDDEVTGMLIGWQALESRAAARKLAGVRELIRRRAPRSRYADDRRYPGDLPARWDFGVAHEVAAALGISWQAADPLVALAWDLEARLPHIGRLLDDGVLSYQKTVIIAREFSVLSEEKAAEAEKLLLEKILDINGRLRDGMTPGAIGRLCQQIADTVDPEGARERREAAEREQARVRFYRDHGGAASMFAGGLPTDEALVAQANVQKRALEYRNAGIYPDEKMDLLRVLALLDSVNGVTVAQRTARYQAAAGAEAGPASEEPDGSGGGGLPAGMPDPGLPTLANMTYPLATVLGEADRPGVAASYGSLDPALTRQLADAGARSPRSRFCVTFTDRDGHAAGHGCARLIRKTGGSRDGPAATGWSFTRDGTRSGPPGGYGSWILAVPGGRRYRVEMHKIPLHECDHTYATDAYRPSDLLRHLVQVRDGQCTFTGCSHPATQCDFEHAVPYDQGGVTDACNAGARSRRCHQVKQKPGWNVTQPEPGWHRWQTPSGRAYTKGPRQYPA